MQTKLTTLQQQPASISYYRGCLIKEVPFSKPKQYTTCGRVCSSYEEAKATVDGAFKALQNSIKN